MSSVGRDLVLVQIRVEREDILIERRATHLHDIAHAGGGILDDAALAEIGVGLLQHHVTLAGEEGEQRVPVRPQLVVIADLLDGADLGDEFVREIRRR